MAKAAWLRTPSLLRFKSYWYIKNLGASTVRTRATARARARAGY